MAEATIWHYTVLPHLLSMFRDGFIKPATAFVEPPERPIVWFSLDQPDMLRSHEAVISITATCQRAAVFSPKPIKKN
jgi:hypothetical protein